MSTPAPNTPPPGDPEHHLNKDLGNGRDEQEQPEQRRETETQRSGEQ